MVGNDLRKPRRDRIARQAEEAAERQRLWEEKAEAAIVVREAFRQNMRQLVREYFDFRNGREYPCEGRLVQLLDLVRLEFFDLQKEVGVGGQQEGSYMVPDDPRFGTQGDREPLGFDEQQADRAFQQGKGPMPHFRQREPENGD